MPDRSAWPRASVVQTPRLVLEPLRAEHADRAAEAFDDLTLHEFIGGRPLTLEQLRSRYEHLQSPGSPSGDEGWLNWAVLLRRGHSMLGTVQATLHRTDGVLVAQLAWTTARAHQRRGYATEAASAMIDWLCERGAGHVTAHINPANTASITVARRVGMSATGTEAAGETVWARDAPLSGAGSARRAESTASKRRP